MNVKELLEFIMEHIPGEAESGITFDYDSFDTGIAWITTSSGDFKLKLEKIPA